MYNAACCVVQNVFAFSKFMILHVTSVYSFLCYKKAHISEFFLRYLDETFRISRAICDQYDPEVCYIFEPQKRSYGQNTVLFELDSSNFW